VILRRLRRIFDRRAARFHEAAFLPREIAQRMGERLDYVKLAPLRVLDAGCGPGADLPALRERFAQAMVVGVDVSRQMAEQAAQHESAAAGGRRWLPRGLQKSLDKALGGRARTLVQGDFAALPFASGAFQLLWSNLALHWHDRPDQVFPEWQRVLQVGGLLMFSTFGPDTLRELRAAWQEAEAEAYAADGAIHVLDFVDMHDFGDMLVASGFEIPVMDMETLTITYRSAESLLADVRRWGAYPCGGARYRRGLTGRRAHAALLAALERQRRADGTLALTFEVVYGHAWKAAPRRTEEGYGIVRLDEIQRGATKNR
jgi:malonyl-CoA O-methyltransferase